MIVVPGDGADDAAPGGTRTMAPNISRQVSMPAKPGNTRNVPGAKPPAAAAPARGPTLQPVQPSAQRPAAATPLATPAPQGGDPLIGVVLHGQYRLIKKLGEGGYGAVYEAKDVNLERRVAIKVMLQSRAASREYVAKFLREARTAAQLTHPNVVSVHGVGYDRDHNLHFLAMEYVQGVTIHDVLQQSGPMSAEKAIDFIVQSCRGLHAAHQRNIIHRDIKPGNLMVTPAGVIKITDFGLAKVYDEAAAASTVIGTPYFMPPEQFEGKAKDGRTDIYALGITFYYMLTMQRPHTGAGPAQILLSVMTKEPPSILEHRPDLPEGLWPIVRRMIARDLDKRYSSCAQIASDLLRLTGGEVEEEEQIYCPGCGAGNSVDADTCASCNESLQEHCPVCNEVDAAGTKFCGGCGANIPLERAVLAFADEARALIAEGSIDRAREKLQQALERSPQNLAVATLVQELETRRELRDQHRDAVRDLLAQGRPQDALDRWNIARNEFPGSSEIADLESDVQSALTARDAGGSPADDAAAAAQALEDEGRIREALVAWRGVLVLSPTSDVASKGEARTRDRVAQADDLAAAAIAAQGLGDPDTAFAKLREAAELLPKDPVIEGRLREATRIVRELDTEIAAAAEAVAAGAAGDPAERLRILVSRHRGSHRLADALAKTESASRKANEGAYRERLEKALQRAKSHEEAHRLREAAACFRDAAAVDPENAEAQQGLIRMNRELAEFDAFIGQSKALLASGDPEGAVAAAETALAKVADDTEAKAQLARSRSSLETLKHEAERIRAAKGSDTDDDDVLSWARELSARFSGSPLAAQVLRETEQACRAAVDRASDERRRNLLQRAEKLESDGQFELALQTYREAIEAAPDDASLRQAADALRKRIDDATDLTKRAAAALAAGDPDTAQKLAEESLKLVPGAMDATRTLAGCRSALEEIARAVETFEEMPTLERAEAQLERYKRFAAKYPASARCAKLADKAATVAANARTTAQALLVASQLSAATDAVSAGRLTDAERILGSLPDPAAGKPLADKIAARRASGAEKLAAATAHAAEGRHEAAIPLFEAALAANPELAEATAGLDASTAEVERRRETIRKAVGEAQQLDRARRPRDAVEAWRRVLTIDPANAKAPEEIQRLETFLKRAAEANTNVRAILDSGDPEEAVAAAQEARARLGAWPEIEELQREARAKSDELDQALKAVERTLGSAEGSLAPAADAAKAVLARFPKSERARELSSRAAIAAENRRRAIAIAEVKTHVREHRYQAAIDLATELHSQGVQDSDLSATETQARKVVRDLADLRARADSEKSRGELDAAAKSLASMLEFLPKDAAIEAEIAEIEGLDQRYKEKLDLAEAQRRRGQLTRALEHYREALGFNATSEHALRRVAEAQTLRDRRSALLADCRAAVASGDGDACVLTARQIIELCPDDDDARDMQTTGESMKNIVGSLAAYARRAVETGEIDAARQAAECILRIAPGHAEAKAILAKA